MTDRNKYLVLAVVVLVAGAVAPEVATKAGAAESSYTSIAEKHCRKFDQLKIDGR